MKIFFVTHNQGKMEEVKAILDDCEIEQINDDYPEMRSDSPQEIVEEAVEKLANKYGKGVMAEDSGLFINSLGEFPGTSSAYIHKRIGLKGLLKLLEDKEDRSCEYRSAVGYCEPNSKPVSFLGKEKGMISLEEKGEFGFGHDPIFIPEGSEKTYGEMEDIKNKKKFRKEAILKFKKYLEGKK